MNIIAKKQAPETVECDLLVVPALEGAKTFSATLKAIDQALDGVVGNVITEEEFEAKPGKTVLIHTHGRIPARKVLVVGVGEKKTITAESIRRMAGLAAVTAKNSRAKTVAVSFDGVTSAKVQPAVAAQACTEGLELAAYSFTKYKGKEERKNVESLLESVVLLAKDAAAARNITKGITTGALYAEGAIIARGLVNEPAVHMKPKTLVAKAEEIAKQPGVSVKIYNEAEIKKLKMGAFLAVAAGSDEEPYLIHLTYKPRGKKKLKKIAVCGKGVTFDSGGLSLKPPQYMEAMKQDMAGGAAVLGAFSQLAALKPNIEVHGVIVATENLPSGKATRPGDVVTAYNGKTVEILNTDAEGRLILADALSWAEDTIKPDYLIDIATLTGAAIVALGQEVAAVVGVDRKLVAAVRTASDEAGEPTWELPLVEEYAQFSMSDVADLRNISSVRWADTIMGAVFLKNFVEKTPWAHIDIAGPAWVEQQVLPYAPKGASGFGVRTLLKLFTSLR
ncbi:MAG: leucyl aminopeptidase [Candidatus Kerfeldbacteria bacterium]